MKQTLRTTIIAAALVAASSVAVADQNYLKLFGARDIACQELTKAAASVSANTNAIDLNLLNEDNAATQVMRNSCRDTFLYLTGYGSPKPLARTGKMENVDDEDKAACQKFISTAINAERPYGRNPEASDENKMQACLTEFSLQQEMAFNYTWKSKSNDYKCLDADCSQYKEIEPDGLMVKIARWFN